LKDPNSISKDLKIKKNEKLPTSVTSTKTSTVGNLKTTTTTTTTTGPNKETVIKVTKTTTSKPPSNFLKTSTREALKDEKDLIPIIKKEINPKNNIVSRTTQSVTTKSTKPTIQKSSTTQIAPKPSTKVTKITSTSTSESYSKESISSVNKGVLSSTTKEVTNQTELSQESSERIDTPQLEDEVSGQEYQQSDPNTISKLHLIPVSSNIRVMPILDSLELGSSSKGKTSSLRITSRTKTTIGEGSWNKGNPISSSLKATTQKSRPPIPDIFRIPSEKVEENPITSDQKTGPVRKLSSTEQPKIISNIKSPPVKTDPKNLKSNSVKVSSKSSSTTTQAKINTSLPRVRVMNQLPKTKSFK